MRTRLTPATIDPPASVIDVCARHAAVPPDAIRTLPAGTLNRSEIFALAVADDPSPRYFAKVRREGCSEWSIERECQGLRYLEQHGPRDAHFAAVPLIGCGTEPDFIVTGYREGTSLQQLFEHAVHRNASPEAMRIALRAARAAGTWLQLFREANHVPSDDTSAVVNRIASECHTLLHKLGSRQRLPVEHILHVLDAAIASLSLADRKQAGAQTPGHGDFIPMNIAVDNRGVIFVYDLERFHYTRFNRDLFTFRQFLEDFALRGVHRGRRVSRFWQAWWDGYVAAGASPTFNAVGYLHGVLVRLCWLTSPEREKVGYVPRKRWLRWQERRWATRKAQWLRAVPHTPSELVQHVRGPLL